MTGRIRESDAQIGVFWLAPDRDTREVCHTTRECPDVGPEFEPVTASDPEYGAYFKLLESCDWCRDYHRAARQDSSG